MSISSYTNVDKVLAFSPVIGSASNISSATVYEFVQAATDEIDQALSKRYTLPPYSTQGSASVPVLQTIATRISALDLMTLRALAQWTADQDTKSPFYSRLKEARSMLNDIRDGKAQLLDSSGAVIPERVDIVGAWSDTMGTLPTMHEGSFTDMVQDQNKIDTLLDERDL